MKPVRRSCKKGPGDFALTLVEERQRELKRSQLEGQTEEAVQDNWDFELSDWNTMELTRGTTRKHSWQAFIHMDQCTLHIGVMILQCCPHKIYQLVTMSVDQRVLFFILIREVPLSVSLSPFTLKKKKKRTEGKMLFRITVSTNALPSSQENIQEGKQNIHIFQSSTEN